MTPLIACLGKLLMIYDSVIQDFDAYFMIVYASNWDLVQSLMLNFGCVWRLFLGLRIALIRRF